MSDRYDQIIQGLIDQATAARGEAQLVLLRKVLDTAKAHDDGDLAAEFARHLITVGSHQNRFDYEMIGFGELQQIYESSPKYADLKEQILWYYKWIGEHLPEYLDIPAAQIESFLDRMEASYRSTDTGLRPVHAIRARVAAFMGQNELAQRHAKLWQAGEETESDDCPACQTHARVELLLQFGLYQEAIEAAGPVLAGEQSCDEVPAVTFSRLLLPMLMLGRLEDAVSMASMVQRQVRLTPKLLTHLADHVVFASVLGVDAISRRQVRILLARAVDNANAYHRFRAYRAAWIHFARQHHAGTTTTRLPARSEPTLSPGPAETEHLAALYESRARELAAAFDQRHGTDRFAQILDGAEALINLPLPS